jgi:hypothetical protein
MKQRTKDTLEMVFLSAVVIVMLGELLFGLLTQPALVLQGFAFFLLFLVIFWFLINYVFCSIIGRYLAEMLAPCFAEQVISFTADFDTPWTHLPVRSYQARRGRFGRV